MVSASLVLAASLVGVQYGYQPAEGGGLEYVIHIEPELIASLGEQGITSEIPPDLKGVRRYRIAVSNAAPPRIALPAPPDEPEEPAAQQNPQPTPAITKAPGEAATPEPSTDPQTNPLDPPEPGSRFPLIPPATQPPRQEPAGNSLLPNLPSDSATGAGEQSPIESPIPADPPATNDDRYPTMPDRYPRPGSTPEVPTEDKTTEAAKPQDTSEGDVPPPVLKVDPASAEIPNPIKTYRPAGESEKPTAAPAPVETGDRPWLPLAVTLLALVGSVGANIYMAWTWLGTRRRYRELVHVRATS